MPFDPSAARSGGITSDNPSYRGGWLCYINGVEVPILGWSVTSGVWQIPQFQIYLAPDPDIEELGREDRVQVAIFYLDQHVDPVHPEWRLLVDGEIIGRSGQHVAGARALTFTCLANIHVFKQLYFFFMNTVDDIVAAQAPEVAVAGATASGLFYPYSLFHQGLFAPRGVGQTETTSNGQTQIDTVGQDDTSTTADDVIKAPYELVYNVIRGIIDKNADPENKHRSVPMMNFFARHVRKTRLHNRFVRLPLLEDVAALANRKGVFPIFNAARNDEALAAMQRQMAARVSNAGPVWNILEQTLGTVYMEIAMVPNPACVITNLQGEILSLLDASSPVANQATGPADKTPSDGNPVYGPPLPPSVGIDSKTPVRLAQNFIKPEFRFGVAPLCNVFFPSTWTSFSDDESFINQPTRTYVNDSVMTRLMRGQGAQREFMLHALTVAYPEEADAVLHHHVSGENDGTGAGGSHETGKDLLIPYEELFKGPVVSKMELPSWFQMLVQTLNSTSGSDDTTRPAAVVQPPPRTVARPSGTGDTQNGANASQTPPQLPAFTPRGRPGGAQFWPNAYRPSTSTEAKVATLSLRTDPMPTVDSVRTSLRSDGNVQLPVYAGLRTLGRFLKRTFPDKIVQAPEYVSGWPVDYRLQSGTTKLDPHKAGRAVDLFIPTLRGGQPNLALGNVVADWLAEHAQEIGVQYFIWARTQFSVDRTGRGKFTPYTRSDGVSSPHVARFDHFNHIHLELNLPGARMETPFFLQNGGANTPTEAANATVVTPRSQTTTSSQQEIRTQISGPTPNSAPVTTVTRPATTVRNYTNEGGVEPTRAQSFQRLFRIYAQYQYLRDRYMQRNAGLMTMFNPYVVPGFPCVILDHPRTSAHRVGYVMQVTHTATTSNWQTQVSIACVRTFREFLNDVKNDCERFSEKVASAPAEIIPEIRRVAQDEAQSEVFFQKLLHGGSRPNNYPAAFHYDQVLGYQVGNAFERITVTGESVDSAARIREEADAAALAEQTQAIDPTQNVTSQNANGSRIGTLTSTNNIDPNRTLQVLPDTIYADCFDRADTAMQMCARPACTLTQYIRFWHGGLTLGQCIVDGHVEGEETDFTYLGFQEQDVRSGDGRIQNVIRQPAAYWRRIYRLRQGPGAPLTESQRGYVADPAGPSATREGVPGDYPQTRANWDEVLLAYRDKIRSRVSSEE